DVARTVAELHAAGTINGEISGTVGERERTGDVAQLEIARAVREVERLELFEIRVAAGVDRLDRQIVGKRDVEVEVGIASAPESVGLFVRHVGLDVDHAALAPHIDLRLVEQALFAGAGDAARIDPGCAAAPDDLEVTGAGVNDHLLSAGDVY